MAAPPTFDPQESKGIYRLSIGAGVGLAGAIVAIVLPLVFLWLAAYTPGGFFTLGSPLVQSIGILVIVGAVLFVVSFFLYRRGFAHLRKWDRRFTPASVLCLIGSLGFLLLLVTAALLLGSTSSLVACLHGAPSHALSCIRSEQPLGEYTSLIGFWLAWIGGVGILLGLSLAGRRFASGMLSGGAVLYGLLLIVLVGPFVVLFVTLPGASYLTLVAPALAILAPALAFGGASRAFHIRST
ncbi:MAG: hypothetical protein WCA77_02070 [Thermoplasmata archaeon]